MTPDEIRRAVSSRNNDIRITEDWITPAGRPRNVSMYEAEIENEFLGESRLIKGKDRADVLRKAREQLQRWDEAEIRQRTKDVTEASDDSAREEFEAIQGLLQATLGVDDKLDWNAMYDKSSFPPFSFESPPSPLALIKKPWYAYLLPFLARRGEHRCAMLASAKRAEIRQWEARRAQASADHERRRLAHEHAARVHNEQVANAKRLYESGDAHAVTEYLGAVFERSSYPRGFFIEHAVAFEPSSQTAVIDIELPPQSSVPSIVGYKFVAARNESAAVHMKPKEHAELYDASIKKCVLRTLHEVFESDYAGNAQACVVNGFVTDVDRSTGLERRTCIISVSANRVAFQVFDLSRVDPTACIKKLKGLIAGPLSEIAPVRPILQLSREDARFIDSRDVLDDLGERNLAEMPWEDFEHLVRELCAKMFANEGAEVRITQASRDQGVDAIAFDPDPIRGGKFVIQAKRYTKVVPVSSVRDLYGTLINEGATRGMLVTTAHFGRDSREFAKDKPLTLIDGSNLVYLLERHGYRVRLDLQAARRKAAG